MEFVVNRFIILIDKKKLLSLEIITDLYPQYKRLPMVLLFLQQTASIYLCGSQELLLDIFYCSLLSSSF